LLQEVAERRRAEEGLQQQLTRINLLNSITRAIASRQSLESMVQTVLRQLEDHLPVAFGRVYLYDASSQTLNVCAHGSATCFKSPEGDLFPRSIPIEQTGMQACLKGETITCQNTEGVDSPVQMQLSRLGLRASVAVPLKVENELFAILLTARREENAFSSSECEFLRVLSEQVALAAHQARLHTQLQGAYDELRTTQQAVMQEERLRALGQMASGIAHDINNALCPIVVYSDLLLQGVSGLDKPIQKQLQNIKTAGEDIAHIVSRMREFYRKREGNEGLGPVSLNKLAIQVVDLTRPRWRDIPQARGITLQMDTELEPNLPDIQGNESELREALTNLILNSVDAMPDGGILALRTHVKGMDARNRDQRQHGHVVLEVCDSGIGMSEETRKHCLEPFFSTKGQHGTGLGLAMVYGIVERHEGHIEIESAIGKGTVMRIVFPVRAKQTEVVETSLRRPEPMPLLKVLCIDDEPLLREMLKQILETGGHQVEVADGGQAGLDLFRQARAGEKPFDVVITDLGMPHVDGNQVSKTLKRESSATPIIMLTGWGTIMKEDGDLPAQVDAVLCKPPKIAELYDVLRKVTTRKAA
jgi:signal transduction histidine kinase/ActR/RegA family two-component response regulator